MTRKSIHSPFHQDERTSPNDRERKKDDPVKEIAVFQDVKIGKGTWDLCLGKFKGRDLGLVSRESLNEKGLGHVSRSSLKHL